MSQSGRQICFIDMPFGKKTDPKAAVEIDFDRIYEAGIKPAVEDAGLECIRGDREETGGIIHTAMFARLLLAEFVVADMTAANPNVFYELGVRHAAKPYTTIPIFATLSAPPFDVNMVRAIPYDLDKSGILSDDAAAKLRTALAERIRHALTGPVTKDSPLFQLFTKFPGIEMSHELTDVFRDRVAYSQQLKDQLAAARAQSPREAAQAAIHAVQTSLGNLVAAERGVLIDLLLSYRAIEDWEAMITLYDAMPGDVKDAVMTRQQLALALNRRNVPGDRERAIRVLNDILASYGDSAETLGILGRVYKDCYRAAIAPGADGTPTDPIAAAGWLDEAIAAYERGFQAEPLDFYPGVNALTLMLQKDGTEAEISHLAPLVTFAAVRKGGDKSDDYWTVATVLELACLNRDYALAQKCLPRLVMLGQRQREAWMLRTTRDNLQLIARRRAGEDGITAVEKAAQTLDAAATRLEAPATA